MTMPRVEVDHVSGATAAVVKRRKGAAGCSIS